MGSVQMALVFVEKDLVGFANEKSVLLDFSVQIVICHVLLLAFQNSVTLAYPMQKRLLKKSPPVSVAMFLFPYS